MQVTPVPYLLTTGGELLPISEADADDLDAAGARSFYSEPGSKASGYIFEALDEAGADTDDRIYLDPAYGGE